MIDPRPFPECGRDVSYPSPPAHLQPYVRVLGIPGALTFLLTFGGSEVYLTSSPKRRARLVEMIGPDKAAELAELIARLKVRVPTAKPWIAQCMHAEDLSTAEIARRLHTADNTVRRWLRATSGTDGGGIDEKDPRQLSLF
ncbi:MULTISPECIES: helix-turn-helix domain-containing protein [unclassified Marinovum]|uniref:helix-turn-helix domain-containing protein n=1 Tax=unclassified Marinovum TaxID=2647166 RepID=UPI003EDBC6F9